MKIAICSVQEFNPMVGGIERVSVSLAQELIKRGHEVVFVSCRKSPYSEPYDLPAKQYTLPSAEDYAGENVEELCGILLRESVDVVLNQNAHSEPYNRMIAEVREKSGVPVVSALHFDPMSRIASNRHLIDFRFNTLKQNVVGALKMLVTTWPLTYFSMRSQKRLLRNLYLNSDAVVLLSETFLKPYVRLAGLEDCDRLCVVNNMLSWPLEFGIKTKKENIVLFVGRLMWSQKRPEQLLKAWLKLEERLPGWRVLIVGDGPERNILEGFANELNLRNVSFEGFRDPVEYYKKAKIYVMTSSHEGWGLTLSEAMQYGCVPIVYNTFSSVTDQITEGENGYLVHPFDVDELAEKILMLANDEDMRRRVSKKAIESRERFIPERIAQEWERVFSRVIKGDSNLMIEGS